MAKDARSKQLIESIQADKQAYFREGDSEEKRGLELKILAKQAELAERLIEAKESVAGVQGDFWGRDGIATKAQEERAKQEAQQKELTKPREKVARAKVEIQRLASHKKGINRGDIDTLRVQHFDTGDNPTFLWHVDFAEVFTEKSGFDVVIGNPPYGLLNKKQNKKIGIPVTREVLEYFKTAPEYVPALGRMLNIFRLFIVRSTQLLKGSGIFVEIFPLAFIGDLSAANLRKYVIRDLQLLMIEAFPERDNPKRRVFEAAKMSVCIAVLRRASERTSSFTVRINTDRFVDFSVTPAVLTPDTITLFDPKHCAIPLMSQQDVDLVRKIYIHSVMLGSIAHCYTGEIDMTLGKKYFTDDASKVVLLKGAIIDRYTIRRKMSQGEIVYLDADKYLAGRSGRRTYNHAATRIVMQGVTGINERVRLKATFARNVFCANSVNYLVLQTSEVDEMFVLAVLNSRLANYVFKKFSTNSNVNGYEVDNLSFPREVPIESE